MGCFVFFRHCSEYGMYSRCAPIKIIIDCRLKRPSPRAKWPQACRRQTRRVDGGEKEKKGRSEGPAITVTVSNISGISRDSNDLFLPYLTNRGWHVKQTMPVAISAGHGSVYLAYHYSSNDCCLLPQRQRRPGQRTASPLFYLLLPTIFPQMTAHIELDNEKGSHVSVLKRSGKPSDESSDSHYHNLLYCLPDRPSKSF